VLRETAAHPRGDSRPPAQRYARSIRRVRDAHRLLPDGVSSPIRTFSAVSSPPLCVTAGSGARVEDLDGNSYVDYMLGLGPLILGHAHPAVVKAVQRQAELGTVFACPTEIEYQLAEMILQGVPFVDQLRFVCSGTEATMTAVRIARAFTGRRALVKCAGCYHGHSDALLAGGSAKSSAPSDPSVLVLDYNDPDGLRAAFTEHRGEIAAIIMEPVACNMGLVRPTREFVTTARELCDEHRALLIFDEVVTGFRFAYGSAAGLVGAQPDIVTFGKIIGGGTPIGAYAGPRSVMRLLDGVGGVFQGGTFAGNPLSMAAGVATLTELRKPSFYERLEQLGAHLEAAIEPLRSTGADAWSFERIGSVASLMPRDSAGKPDADRYSQMHARLMERGHLLPPAADETLFLCSAHTAEDLRRLACDAAAALA
jgi:glutamate-1-semialdehyde 2,1-aminomutase